MTRVISFLCSFFATVATPIAFGWGIFENILMWVWMRPISSAQTVSIFCHVSWQNMLVWLAVILGDLVINFILINLYDYRAWTDVIDRYIKPFRQCSYQPVNLQNLLPLIPSKLPYFSPFKGILRFHIIKIYCVSTRRGRLPQEHKTYQMLGSKSPVFLIRHPSKMSDRARFYLFHELGHASSLHLFFVNQSYFATVYFGLLMISIHIRPGFSANALFVALAIFLLWCLYILIRKAPKEEYVELLADQLALMFLADSSRLWETPIFWLRWHRIMLIENPTDERKLNLWMAITAYQFISRRTNFRRTIAQIALEFRKRGKVSPFWKVRSRMLVSQAQKITSSTSEPNRFFAVSTMWETIAKLSRNVMPPKFISLPIVVAVTYIGSQLIAQSIWTLIIIIGVYVAPAFLLLRFIIFPLILERRIEATQLIMERAIPDINKATISVEDFV